MKKEFGIIGYPLHQSASPAFFNKKFADESIDAHYLPFEIENIEELPRILTQHPPFADSMSLFPTSFR